LAELQVIARHSIATGNEDQVYALLPQLITAARTEPGNIAFDAYAALGDRSNYVLLERYTSRNTARPRTSRKSCWARSYLYWRTAPSNNMTSLRTRRRAPASRAAGKVQRRPAAWGRYLR
jgi:hypothetical protein